MAVRVRSWTTVGTACMTFRVAILLTASMPLTYNSIYYAAMRYKQKTLG